MFCLQSTKANGIKTLFEAAVKIYITTLDSSMLYDVLGEHIISHTAVLQKKLSENTSYLTQLRKT